MMLCPGHTIQSKILPLSLLLCGLAAALYLYLGTYPTAAVGGAAGALRILASLGALSFLLCCVLLPCLRALFREKRRVREELEKRHAILSLQTENAPDDIMVVDPAGTVLLHNRRHPELWGTGATAGAPFVQALDALLTQVADRESTLQATRALSGEGGEGDELLLADGRVFQRYSAPLVGGDGRRYGRIWRLRDTSAPSREFAALREREATVRGVLESSADGMVVVDEAHRIVLVNEQFEIMFGYQRSEVLGRDVAILVPRRFARHDEYVREFFSAPRRRMMGHGLKLVALRKDGSEFPAEIGLSPMRTAQGVIVSAAIRDMTEREVAERRLAAAAAYSRTLFEGSPDPLVTINGEGEIGDVNEAMVALTEKTRGELIGSRFRDHFSEPEKAREFRRELFAKGVVRDRPLTVRARSGRLTEVLYNAVVYRDESGVVVGAFASARDMTQRQAMEEELRELNRVLEERVAQRAESLLAQAREVVEAAGVVAAASRSIGEMTNRAMRGAIDTSAALSHTSAALAEVKGTALDSSEKARQVSRAARRSAEVAQEGRTAVQGAVAGMARIQVQVSGSAESIIRLSEQSRAIGDIIATVNDLAEQSNLLAVNAAIEASKAGAQGKGFAVVARAVKNLSDQSKNATAQVRSILEEIRSATDKAVLASEQGRNSAAQGVAQAKKVGEAIGELEESIELSAHAALQIAASCQQQLVGIDQVSRAMENITEASGQNVLGMKRLEGTLKHLEELGERLRQLSAVLTG